MGNRKEEILIVALHLFARDGYEDVSVNQIAGELDMTKVYKLNHPMYFRHCNKALQR